MRSCALLPLLVLLAPPTLRAANAEDPLKLLISVEQPSITAPYPARVTLHLHNSGQEPLWLYRRARSQATDGSMLEVHLEPVMVPGTREIGTAARGVVFESAGLPRPKFVRLASGEDYTEKTTLKMVPALAGTDGSGQPVWGRYRLAVTYRAHYSNAETIQRILDVELWQGEVTSNTIEMELQPPVGEGSVTGTAISPDGRPLDDVLVSLSDQEEHLVDQVWTDAEGRFSFTHLPLSLYWVTVRRPNLPEDTTVFRHLVLTPSEPSGAIEFALLRREPYEPQHLLHKPVLFRVMDSAGRPLNKVKMEVTWSSGTVLDNVKGEGFDDGTIALELIPGRNFVTLKRRGCRKEEQRVDVTAGGGIDGFKLTLDCSPN